MIHKQGRVSEAVAEFREATRLDPSQNSHFEIGVHLSLNGQLDGAISEFREAIRAKAGSEQLHLILGYLLYRKGEVRAAFDEFRQAFILSKDCCYSH